MLQYFATTNINRIFIYAIKHNKKERRSSLNSAKTK
jgi:hypothetical protein